MHNFKNIESMKGMKFSIGALCAAMLLSGCSMSNTAKGGLIGGGGGGALGALIGQLAGGGKGAAIGAAIGTTLGAGAGVIIGNKMDKAKKAAEAANAKAEIIEGNDGISYVKATFPSGILLQQENMSSTQAPKTTWLHLPRGWTATWIFASTDTRTMILGEAQQLQKAKKRTSNSL